MRGCISSLYKSRMRSHQSAMKWKTLLEDQSHCFSSVYIHSNLVVKKNVMSQGEGKNSTWEDVRQTRQTSPVRAEGKRTGSGVVVTEDLGHP